MILIVWKKIITRGYSNMNNKISLNHSKRMTYLINFWYDTIIDDYEHMTNIFTGAYNAGKLSIVEFISLISYFNKIMKDISK
jgi:hypothetical protein